MKILIDIGHPAHVHYFKNLANHFISEKQSVLFTCRNKDVVIQLLERLKFDYKSIGFPFKTILGKIFGILIFDLKILIISLKYKPDIFLSSGSIYASHIAFLLRRPHITLEDTFNMEQVRLYLPFTDAVLTGSFDHIRLGDKEIIYEGYQELTYLHPKYFTPDIGIKEELGIMINEKYFIVRFVSWNASHDVGFKGLSNEGKRKIVGLLVKYGKVLISSETVLPEEFEEYKFPLTPDRMHHALSFATLFVGEGATMASECAVLGIPAVYINPNEAGSIDEHEKSELVYHFRNEDGVTEKIRDLLNNPKLKVQHIERSKKLIEEKIDVTSFLIWFIENWPESFRIMKDNPKYQENFIDL